jgi:hypothetical protein
MFRTPVAELPHREPEPDPDAEVQLLRITRAIEEIGLRNDALRRRLSDWRLVERLIANAERLET